MTAIPTPRPALRSALEAAQTVALDAGRALADDLVALYPSLPAAVRAELADAVTEYRDALADWKIASHNLLAGGAE